MVSNFNLWREKLSRRKFLAGALAGGAGLAGSAGGWVHMNYIEPNWLELVRIKVNLAGKKLSRRVRILQLSDFHYSRTVPLGLIHESINLGLAEKPDLICLTGDFVTRGFLETKNYIAALKRLSAAAPSFACLGNHDGGAWSGPYGGYESTEKVREVLRAADIKLLHNKQIDLSVADTRLRLVGVGDLWARQCEPNGAFKISQPDDRVTILLSHNPDSKLQLAGYRWDLMLCGHTHGGQLNIPLIGAPFAPVQDKNFVAGLYNWNERWIYITRGVGNLHGVRLNCRPEVTVLDLLA